MRQLAWKEFDWMKEVSVCFPEEHCAQITITKDGGGLYLPLNQIFAGERYLCMNICAKTEHSLAMQLQFFCEGETEPAFKLRFGLLPQVKTFVTMDMEWLEAKELFPESNVGELKLVCHGRRVKKEEVVRAELVVLPMYHDVEIELSDLYMSNTFPGIKAVAKEKMIDELGQTKRKEWSGKTKDLSALKQSLTAACEMSPETYCVEGWNIFGADKTRKLTEGTGFFSSCKKDGRWWLTDPDGYAFFSVGVDCVNVSSDCRIDGVEDWLDWLPSETDAEYQKMFRKVRGHNPKAKTRREGKLFSFMMANLYRTFGKDWHSAWKKLIVGQMKQYGLNTIGNWSNEELFGTSKIPYVTSLPSFPATDKLIFRDFPDVLSEEYKENAKQCAKALEARKEDPYMIGYFLRNEPNWAFVDDLILADEVLYNPEKTVCKEKLISYLQEKYKTIESLNAAWKADLASFSSLYESQDRVSTWSEHAYRDMKEFSKILLRAYVEIPCKACREIDKNHMILGMRWAWISDPDLVTGWELFDVFSINCYAVDPTASIAHIVELGVDLPVMIGEFHFGALDAGLTATGLEGVTNQHQRGIAYRHYIEMAAAHPNGVGCHYFQCYDQFALGRFDGENYNIGLFDVCLKPYTEMMEQVIASSEDIYAVMAGEQPPFSKLPESIPMIAY